MRPTMDPQRVRYSAPFFYNPNYDALVTPLTTQCTTPIAPVAHTKAATEKQKTDRAALPPVESVAVSADGERVEDPVTTACAQEEAPDSLYGANLQEQIQQATAAARYNGIRWGDYRNQRFQGDFKDMGEEVQIEHFQAQA